MNCRLHVVFGLLIFESLNRHQTSSSSNSTREQRYIRSGKMSFVQNPSIAFYGQDRVNSFSGDMFCRDPSMNQLQNQFALKLGPQNSAQVYTHLKRRSDSLLDSVASSSATTDPFDYDFVRPTKKYIAEDKVIEIFDRLHIREGENYIVEDVDDVKDTLDSAIDIDPDHNVVIEELPEDCGAALSVEF